MNLDALIENFQKKDVSAFEKLYNMYGENICGVINVILKDSERSKEICQDVFIKVWNNSSSYDASKGRFFTWILNIARNTAIDELRSKSNKEQKRNLSIDSFVGILEETEEMGNQVDVIGLKKMLKGLKELCREIISLLYFKGYTQKEAAEELGIPLGTVKTRNRNCISQIRKNNAL
ncbi:RNA polymerase sigma factor [Flagellimonas meridianipacifica]|uniref:RNA polymerase sigma-70 factor (ECF subfamily) n=1 Tax=Flagellimonas meridianipacifica TaxID=1080225 RepID=A0A2T0MA19_9FLAO|nr:sigma-70 family RNA polymerase sigma factor [Allomuricauda pacifica]PRX54323.1 RNA polymerase sigma-70 factor (ECF subfamily) [Allomuricauda pacifica]